MENLIDTLETVDAHLLYLATRLAQDQELSGNVGRCRDLIGLALDEAKDWAFLFLDRVPEQRRDDG